MYNPYPAMQKAVHACRRHVASLSDDDAWRDFLALHGGHRSTKDMNVTALGKVLDALHQAGAPASPKARVARPTPTKDQDGVIRDLWHQLWTAGGTDDAGEAALAAWAKRISKVDALAFARPMQKRIMIEALKDWLRRLPADPVAPLRLAARGPDGRTDFVKLCDGLWNALAHSGALEAGILADPGTWLKRQGFGVSAFLWLDQGQARDAAKLLAGWLRKATGKEAAHV
ncbi:regulatory protein GemA [Niveispirillum sp. SYP-B3756]|uniref:regulatory protein GemA n=1 Tax=Niveispirillum sp. SYP-B3756 TaxID=2662178 RepID=UPI001567C0C9|nr:regulatory protein GemA [Niveispirillum sp. SYP-B3756]